MDLYYRKQMDEIYRLKETIDGVSEMVISKENYELLNRLFSFDDYDKFFEETFGEAGAHPLIEGVEIDGSTLDDPILNLPNVEDEDWTEPENEEDVIDEDDGNYFIF